MSTSSIIVAFYCYDRSRVPWWRDLEGALARHNLLYTGDDAKGRNEKTGLLENFVCVYQDDLIWWSGVGGLPTTLPKPAPESWEMFDLINRAREKHGIRRQTRILSYRGGGGGT